MSREPDIDRRTPDCFLEPTGDSDDFDSDLEDLSIDNFDISESGPSLIRQIEGNLDLETQLLRYLDQGLSPEEAVGKLNLYTGNVPFWRLEKNWYKLDEKDAARLFLYRSLSSLNDYAIEHELKDGVAERLGLNDVVTENTIERISEEVEAQIGTDVSHRLRKIVEQLEDNDEIVTLPTTTADDQGRYPFTANQLTVDMLFDMEGIDVGEVRNLSFRSKIVREVFGDGYPFLLDGDPEFENWGSITKDCK